MTMLIIFAGLPATGKTTVARTLASELEAVYLRIDSIEQAMRDSHAATQVLDDAGYRVAYAIAEENLRLGQTVIADSVNPIAITRDMWREVAARISVRAVEVEVICSDVEKHRQRVERRASDIPGLKLPSWDEIVSREYHGWDRDRVIVDTALLSADECVAMIRAAMVEHVPGNPK